MYGVNPESVIVLLEVCVDCEGCSDIEHVTEYCVIGADAGIVGEGADHDKLIEEEETLNSLTLWGGPGTAKMIFHHYQNSFEVLCTHKVAYCCVYVISWND